MIWLKSFGLCFSEFEFYECIGLKAAKRSKLGQLFEACVASNFTAILIMGSVGPGQYISDWKFLDCEG